MKGARLTRDVVQHAQPEQRICKSENCARNNRRPKRGLPITGKSEPQKSDWEQPDCDERDDESGLRTVVTMFLTVSSIEPGLHWNETEHNQHPNDEVEVSQVS